MTTASGTGSQLLGGQPAARACCGTLDTSALVSTPQVYERAVANLPPGNEKRYWQRYIYLWVKYALWEELDAGEPDRAREVSAAAAQPRLHAL